MTTDTRAKKASSAPKAKHEGEEQFLAAYRPGDYPRPSVTVDLVILTVKDGALRTLLIERGQHPFKGMLALPGGFLRVGANAKDQGEDLEAAARRELEEEAGLSDPRIYLHEIGAFGKPGRDPRMRVISVAFVALVRPELAESVRAGGDAAGARFVDLSRAGKLAFDHADILAAARAFVRRELESSNIAFELSPVTFTVQDLRATYEVILGETLDPGNFRKRFLRMLEDGVIVETDEKRKTPSKPARIYRFARPS
jgi:8-oxo-dGTP diphosphatase